MTLDLYFHAQKECRLPRQGLNINPLRGNADDPARWWNVPPTLLTTARENLVGMPVRKRAQGLSEPAVSSGTTRDSLPPTVALAKRSRR